MVRFINIETLQVWAFENWDDIIKQGGLKNLLPIEQWNYIWNEKAALETACAFYPLHNRVEALCALHAFNIHDKFSTESLP